MRFLFFSLAILYSFQSFSDSEMTDVFVEEAREQRSDCFFCNLPLPNNKLGTEKLCGQDPYQIICSNIKNPDKRKKKSEREIQKVIEEGRKKALKSMGHSSMEDAIKSALDEKGVSYNSKALGFRNAIKDGERYKFSTYLNGYSQCVESFSSIHKIPHFLGSEDQKSELITKWKKHLNKLRNEVKGKKTQLNQLRASNLESFYKSFIELCDKEKKNNFSKTRGKSRYSKLAKDCHRKLDIQREIIDLYRLPDGSAKKIKSRKFASQFSYVEYLKYREYTGPLNNKDDQIKGFEHTFDQIKNTLFEICSKISSNESSLGDKIFEETLVKTHTNKIFIDHVFSELYGNDKIAKFKNTVQSSRSGVVAALPRIFPDSQSHDQIKNSLQRLEINTPLKPSNNLYSQKNGNLFLDESKLGSSRQHNTLQVFFDPSLRSIKSFNAYYRPSIGKYSAHVTPRGTMFQKNEYNPHGVYSVFAHEFGHHFDPRRSEINNLPLKKEYEKILKCFKKDASIKMHDYQKGETISDFISATAIAKELDFIPQNQRKNVLIEALKPFCQFAGGKYLSLARTHPHPNQRINGIFMANPDIRKAIGCSPEKKYRYKICPSK